MPGGHNRANAAAATLAARAAGVADEAIAQALRAFVGVPHRLELVRELHGVRWVNDSKATNTAAARRAIEAYPGSPLHLILGGSLKGEDFAPLAAAIPDRVRSIHLVGEASDELAQALDAAGVAYDRDGDLPTAVRHAHALASAGDVVLLSPATASFDQFENFEHRGDTFRELVGALT
jgi:UDP-N-acetylmuramoylalanine--D-glutamate ligase